MPLYQRAADQLLEVVNNEEGNNFFDFLNYEGYVFEYRRGYSGLMARINPKYKKYAKP